MTDYDTKASWLPASSLAVYKYWLAKGKKHKEAYRRACCAFNDESKYKRMTRGEGR